MLWQLDGTDPALPFPNPSTAETDPDGLLAVGGDLSPIRLLNAYRQGIFPWYSDGQPILWWSPDPRMVLFPAEINISRSLAKFIRNTSLEIRENQDFEGVISSCAAPRGQDTGTWLTPEMISSYQTLHRQGHAHSIEVWDHDELVGGLYGVRIDNLFFGESMFSKVSNASKMALVHLAEQLAGQPNALIDCQVFSQHLASLGAVLIPRNEFLARINA